MEFEEMQLIWNDQNDEKLFAIDEAALHAQIRRKGESIGRKVDILEWIMIGVNFVVAIVLTLEAVRDGGPAFQYVIAAVYLGYSIIAAVRRLARRREILPFPDTLLGDLDKALWQTNYLIRQSQALLYWYLIPLLSVVTVLLYVAEGQLWPLGMAVLLILLSYFGGRWEVNKFYMPKKREMEQLRKQLLAAEQ